MDEQTKFEGWAVVEMMGHQREIGFVTTQVFGQAVLFRVDVPEREEKSFQTTTNGWAGGEYVRAGSKVRLPARPARSRLLSPGSIYAINPCTEDAAKLALEKLEDRPLILLEAVNDPQLTAGGERTAEDLTPEDTEG